MLFITDRPEFFYTINFIEPAVFKGNSLIIILGLSFVFCAGCATAYYLARRKVLNSNMLVYMLIFFSLPGFINFLYNSSYDFIENIGNIRFSSSNKQLIRLCNLGFNTSNSDEACKIMNFAKKAGSTIPKGAKIGLLANYLEPYLFYFLYPNNHVKRFDASEEYLVLWDPADYYFEGQKLFHRQQLNNKTIKREDLGEYSILAFFGSNRLILKKQ